jgi:hypothetical protein
MSLNAADWLHMVLHFLSLSLITFGGVVAAAPDMHCPISTEIMRDPVSTIEGRTYEGAMTVPAA